MFVPASPPGLSTDEPAQIQQRVTRRPNVGLGQRRGGCGRLYNTQSGLHGQLHLRIRHYDKAEVHYIPDIPSALQHGTVGQEKASVWPRMAHAELPFLFLFLVHCKTLMQIPEKKNDHKKKKKNQQNQW